MDMMDRLFEFMGSANERDIALYNRVNELGAHFEDMLFSEDSITFAAVAVQSSSDSGKTWICDSVPLPNELDYFNYGYFTFQIADLDPDICGCFDCKNQTLTISTSEADNDHVVLHEMIHLHEFVLNEIPMFYRDTYFWCLYKDLCTKIPDLDERITAHSHILNEQDLYSSGGLHDILFLMKSYDLDLKMGYTLGTVMGYGYDSPTSEEGE